MAIITGNVLDFQGAPLAAAGVRVKFSPSSNAGAGAILLATKPIYMNAASDGSFSGGLIANETVYPQTWYTLSIEWLDAAGNYVSIDYPDWKIIVGVDDADIFDVVISSPTALEVWVGETDNPAYGFWYQPSTGLLRR